MKLAVFGILLALAVACGSDVTDSTASNAFVEDPEPGTATPTFTPPVPRPNFVPSPTQTASPDPQLLAACTSESTYILPPDDLFSDRTGWPESSGLLFDPRTVDPWNSVDVPPGHPLFPKFQLSGGMRVPTEVTGNGPVTLGILAANGYQQPVTFELSRDPGYDFAIYDSSGQEVWRYSEQVEVHQTTSLLKLARQEEQLLEAEWDLTGNNGERVNDGIYWVYAIVFRQDPYSWHVGAEPLYVGERPALGEALQVKLLAPETVGCGDRVPMTLTITNISDIMVNLYTGVDFDNYHASVPGKGEFWNWWRGKTKILPLFVKYIAPGETVLFRRSWHLENGDHGRVAPGTYELRASIKAAQVDDIVNRTETAWSNIVEITVLP